MRRSAVLRVPRVTTVALRSFVMEMAVHFVSNNTFCLLGVRPSYSQGIKILAIRRFTEREHVIWDFWLAHLAVPPRSVPAGGHGMVEILVAAACDHLWPPRGRATCSGHRCGTPRVAHVQELVLSFSEQQFFLESAQ